MPNFFQKHVWITRHAIPITQRPGWNTEQSNPHLEITIIIALKQQEKL